METSFLPDDNTLATGILIKSDSARHIVPQHGVLRLLLFLAAWEFSLAVRQLRLYLSSRPIALSLLSFLNLPHRKCPTAPAMADPFSITGSAVGVISLGLTICQAFLAYYGPFKSFHEEINEAVSRVRSLKSLLLTLSDVIANSPTFHARPSPQPIQAAMDSIQSCGHGLQKLQRTLTKCHASVPPGKGSRSANQLNRLLYPFRQETLVKLMGTVTWLQDNLNTSLLLLQL
jgi:hypothetical protein